MRKSALYVYALAVCALLIVPLLICGGVAAYGVLKLAWPEMTMPSHEYRRYQSDDAYREYLSSGWARPPEGGSAAQAGEALSDTDIAQRRPSAFREALERERREGVRDIVRYAVFGLISLTLFLVHWRLARRERTAPQG